MKYLSLAGLLIWAFCSEGQTLHLKVLYTPSTAYHTRCVQSSRLELSYKGSQEVLNNLQAKGVENPKITEKDQVMESVLKTGTLSGKKKFPVSLEIIKTTNSEGTSIVPDGTVIYGYASPDDLPTLDSVASDRLSSELKKNLLGVVKNIFSQIDLPERTLKVGEKFIDKTPLSIPIANSRIDMTITTTYHLLSIEGDTANFELTQDYAMSVGLSDKMTGSGTGKGSIIYSIKNRYYLDYKLNAQMELHYFVNHVDIGVKSSNSFDQSTSIQPD